MKNSIRWVLLGACVVALPTACGSAEDKKKAQGPDYEAGGEAGEGVGATAGRGGSTSGRGGSAGSAGTAGTPEGGVAGTLDGGGAAGTDGGTGTVGGTSTGGTGEAGQTGAASGQGGILAAGGAGGAGGATTLECAVGTGECDDDPLTVCEQDLTLVTSCGACDVICDGTHGTPSCSEGKCAVTCQQSYGNCDGNFQNGCESLLTSNDKNCGACGNDCTAFGSTCSGTLCAGVALQQNLPFGNDNSGARSWAFSPTSGAIASGFNSYTVQRMPLDGSTAVTIWTTMGKTSPIEGMTLVGSDVYWAERGTDTSKPYKSVVFKKALSADPSTLPTPAFIPEYSATFLQRQGNSFYWASGGYQDEGVGGFIYGRADSAQDGGTKLVTADQGSWSNTKALGVTTDALYWVTDQNTGTQYELRTAPLAGSPISVVPAVFSGATLAISTGFANNGGDPVNLIAVGDYLYFNREAGDAFDGVYRYKTGLAKPEAITIAGGIYTMVVDTDYVYFAQRNVAGLWRAPINGGAGGAPVKIMGQNLGRLLGVDAKFVYYATSGCCQTNLFKTLK